MGQSPESKAYNIEGLGKPLVQGNADIEDRKTRPRNWTTQITKECRVGDIIMTVRAPVGHVARSLHNACIGRGVCAIRNAQVSDIDFLYQFLLFFEKKWIKFEQGSTFTAINTDDLKKLKLYAPSLNEQQKIADFLSLVDEWIQNIRTQKESLETYKKGMTQKIFSQEIRFKDENGKDFPAWEEKKLRDLLDYEQPTDYIVESTEYNDKNGTPVLTAGKTFILGYTDEANGVYQQDDLPVIIFDDFTTASQLVNFPFKVKSSAMKILKARKGVDTKFIYEAMQFIQYEIGGHGRHWISKYSHLKVLIPTFEEQQKIADFLTSLDNLIESKQRQIIEAETWKKGLTQELFV